MLLEIKARAKHAACQASSITVEPHNADVGDQVINLAFRFQRQRPIKMFWSQHSPVAPSAEAARNRRSGRSCSEAPIALRHNRWLW